MNKPVTHSGVDPASAHRPPRASICIVTGELGGPDFNGGIGTTNRALALVLRAQGYKVDILYTRVEQGNPFSARGKFVDHVNTYRKAGINLACIDHDGAWNAWQTKSYLALQHLLRHRYNVVFFDDTHGNAYYPLLARRTGNAELRATKMCVTTHSATQWISDLNQTPVTTLAELRLMEMERRSIELADAVKAPSAYILGKYRSYGWTVPENALVLPNFISVEQSQAKAKRIPIKEIVFFGRLETRKGLWMFCRALDRLKHQLQDTAVTFLGKGTLENGVSTVETLVRYSAGWPFPIRVLNNFDRDQALSYLKGGNRLAIIASPEDNSPSAVLECLNDSIPFIACSGSGGEELLHKESRADILFEPSVENLANKITDALAHGATPGRCAFSEAQLEKSFTEWMQSFVETRPEPAQAANESDLDSCPVLVVIVPQEVAADKAAAELLRTIDAYGGRIEIEVLASDPAALLKRLQSEREFLTVSVTGLDGFEKIASSLAYRPATVVGLCHITQMLPPAWFERATQCLAATENIAALTGMAAVRTETATQIREPFFSARKKFQLIERFLMGDALALLPLVQESNAGFALMRSRLLPELCKVPPFDQQYGHLKRMEDWIHELLATLRLSGNHFELVPDLVVEQPVRESQFEVFRLGHFMRSLSHTMLGYAPGSDQALLARLAIDTGLENERARGNAKYLQAIGEQIGRPVYHLDNGARWDTQARQLATIALGRGQVELAVDLSTSVAIQDKSTLVGPEQIDKYVDLAVNDVSLFEIVAASGATTLNLEEEYSFRKNPNKRELELHVNAPHKGLAALVFASLNLSKVNCFSCSTAVPLAGANPIRFRIELTSGDRSNRWSAETVLNAGDERTWELEVPVKLRALCRAVIGVELVDPGDSSEYGFARLTDPRFIHRG
jgi:glycosyltransferase involved in cell wall biosynthesis